MRENKILVIFLRNLVVEGWDRIGVEEGDECREFVLFLKIGFILVYLNEERKKLVERRKSRGRRKIERYEKIE